MPLARTALGLTLLVATFYHIAPVAAADNPSARWEPTIEKFEQADEKSPPPMNGVLFIGSSSIRMWDLNKWFPDRKAINRGFGGSETADAVHFADRILLPYRPRVVVLYVGDNDIAKGKSPEQVFSDWKAFVSKVHSELPETKIVYIAIKPSVKRWELFEKMEKANRLIEKNAEQSEKLVFVDIAQAMLGDDGQPRPELFLDDGLHLNERGYEIWAKMVRPHLGK